MRVGYSFFNYTFLFGNLEQRIYIWLHALRVFLFTIIMFQLTQLDMEQTREISTQFQFWLFRIVAIK